MRSTLTSYLAALGLALLPILVLANDGPTRASNNVSSVFVEQVIAQDSPPASARQIATFSTPGLGPTNIERLNLPRFSAHDGQGTHSIVNQRGRGNRIAVQAMGNGNFTLQRQQGVGLVSDITLVGQRNAIAVDQQGADLKSDIRVLGGNKIMFHVQRGTGPSIHHQPLIYTGYQREVEVILDTPKGRLKKSLSN